jgi:hypothetical protein
MLGKSTTDTGGVFWTKSNAASALVLEVVHLFCNDISGIAKAEENA